MEIICTTIDCADPARVAAFWNAALARLQALGASIAWEEEFPPDIAARYRNVVLRDVEGNEFCLGGGSL